MKIASTVNFAFDYRDFHLARAKSLLISTYDDVVTMDNVGIYIHSQQIYS